MTCCYSLHGGFPLRLPSMIKLKAIGALALILALPGAMNTAGFCWQDGRFLSDAELIAAFANDKAELYRGAQWEAILRGRTNAEDSQACGICGWQ